MNKYRNVRTVVDGLKFDSKAEAARYGELKLLDKAGQIYALQRQRRWPLRVDGVKVSTYISDFDYMDANDRQVVEDVKGMETAVFKLKRKMFEAQYGLKITVIRK